MADKRIKFNTHNLSSLFRLPVISGIFPDIMCHLSYCWQYLKFESFWSPKAIVSNNYVKLLHLLFVKFFKMPKVSGIVPVKLFEARYMQDKKTISFLWSNMTKFYDGIYYMVYEFKTIVEIRLIGASIW